MIFRKKAALPPPKSAPVSLKLGSPESGRVVLAGGWPWVSASGCVGDDPFHAPYALAEVQDAKHGFTWLSDLLVLSERGGTSRAAGLAESWLDVYGDVPADSAADPHRPDVLMRRLHAWVSAWPHLFEPAPERLKQRLLQEIHAGLHRVENAAWRKAIPPGKRAECLANAMMVTLAIGNARYWDAGAEWLMRAIDEEFFADGVHASRSPTVLYENLRSVAALALSADAVSVTLHPAITYAVRKMGSALSCLVHRDGALAVFQGGREEDPFEVARVLKAARVRAIASQELPQGGYRRLDGEAVTVIVDIGAMPKAPFDRLGYASTGAIEVDVGGGRLFVNCGAPLATDPEWALAMRQTAAHSTLAVDDQSIAPLKPDDSAGRPGPKVRRRLSALHGYEAVAVVHDGYRSLGGPFVQRRVAVGEGAALLYGEDQLTGAWAGPFALRFHLHPRARASMGADNSHVRIEGYGEGALRFSANQGRFTVEESIYFGKDGLPAPTQQIVVEGDVHGSDCEIRWVLAQA